ncbi:hypothetical protein [Pseudomonas zeae]|uniref:hypothetical protein n=1 Tax=Pseudomonas zeae TaxID=2745510 RepID=UPI0039DFD7AE
MRTAIFWVVLILWLIVAAFTWWFLPLQYTASREPIAAGVSLVTGGLALFILIILAPIGPMLKGIALLALAVITALMNTITIEPMLAYLNLESSKEMVNKEIDSFWFSAWVSEHLKLTRIQSFGAITKWLNAILYFINLACAGAGASLIAVAGERKKDASQNKVHPTGTTPSTIAATDISPLIRVLGEKIDKQFENVSDLTTLIAKVEAQVSTLNAKQIRLNRILQIIAIAVASMFIIAIGAVIFGRS